MSEDLSQSITAVCGVILSRLNPQQEEQVSLKNLVLVDSKCRNLRQLAMAVASQKPVLLEGPIGCGKTGLVEYLAVVTGHVKAPEILKVQLGDQTDSKQCTDVPSMAARLPDAGGVQGSLDLPGRHRSCCAGRDICAAAPD